MFENAPNAINTIENLATTNADINRSVTGHWTLSMRNWKR